MANERPTQEMIDAEPAGNRMNRWVVEFVFGHAPRDRVGLFSTHIGVAFDVVAFLSKRGYSLTLEDWRDSRHGRWMALFQWPDGHDSGAFMADTAPLAICRAALHSKLAGAS